MVIKSRKRTVKTPAEELIIKGFMEDPLPMGISRTEDGNYVEVNKAALKIMGLPRKQIIGHTSIELGFFTPELRKSLIDDLKKQGFVKNVQIKIIVNNQEGICLFFRAFPIRMGKENFLMVCATGVVNHKSTIGEFSYDKIFTVTQNDEKFIKEKLKQYRLSPREQEIALLSSTGHSNDEIAKKLFISSYTVKDHQKEIFRIIDVHGRNEIFPKLLNLR